MWVKDQYLGGRSTISISREVGCTDANILRILRFLGISRRSRAWTRDEINTLKNMSSTKNLRVVAGCLSRSYISVRLKATKLGISSAYLPGEETRKIKNRRKISATLQGVNIEGWKGFTQPLAVLIRKSENAKKWRTQCFVRDKFACVLCGVTGVFIEADHFPRQFAVILKENGVDTLEKAILCEELWDISNGRTLCKPCHKIFGLRKRS